MHQTNALEIPRRPPAAVHDLCTRIEEAGIAVWSHGEGLLADLLTPNAADIRDAPDARRREPGSAGGVRGPTRALLCGAEAGQLLRLLPAAVVTASEARRLTVATDWGPVDLLPIGTRPVEQMLIGFGLGAFGFSWRAASEAWCDPVGARSDIAHGRLAPTTLDPNPFVAAPRRFWIAARLLAELDLEPTESLLEAARAALEPSADALPLGAPARREITRILFAPNPERGLAFLRESGLSPRFFPGLTRGNESIVGALAPLPALRWAGWLKGTAVQSALVKLRVPHALGRAIGRVLQIHPIDEATGSAREVGLRKMLQRLSSQEIDGLLDWRRHEIEAAPTSGGPELERLEVLARRIDRAREQQSSIGRVRSLALDGQAVMGLLDAGPGPHVGRALAHLAGFVESHPDANRPAGPRGRAPRVGGPANRHAGLSLDGERSAQCREIG